MLRISLAAVLAGGCLTAATAFAQGGINPEGGDVWVPPADDTGQDNPPPPQEQPPPPVQTAPVEQPAPPPTEPVDTRDDHQQVVGRLALGFMGSVETPIGSDISVGAGVTTPAIGARIWFTELLGLDAGLGLGYEGGNVTNTGPCAGMAGLTCPTNDRFAFLLHAGVPLALAHDGHFTFVLIPEVNLAFATGTQRPTFDPANDVGETGFLFRVGARAGAEIHFGFMGIPQLAVQAAVGLYFDYRTGSTNPRGITGTSASGYSLATSLAGQPWDIFTGSLQALYYL
jgi:hypothetical protein